MNTNAIKPNVFNAFESNFDATSTQQKTQMCFHCACQSVVFLKNVFPMFNNF